MERLKPKPKDPEEETWKDRIEGLFTPLFAYFVTSLFVSLIELEVYNSDTFSFHRVLPVVYYYILLKSQVSCLSIHHYRFFMFRLHFMLSYFDLIRVPDYKAWYVGDGEPVLVEATEEDIEILDESSSGDFLDSSTDFADDIDTEKDN